MNQKLLEQSEIPGVETPGEMLTKARKKKKVSVARAAEATRMKLSHLEAMERNDFTVFAAATYAKGFIKIYAEYLGLDPLPLVQLYVENFAPKSRAPLIADHGMDQSTSINTQDTIKRTPWPEIQLPQIPWANLAKVLAGLAIILVVILSIGKLGGKKDASEVLIPPPALPETPHGSRLIAEPPDPYLSWEYMAE